MKVKKTNRNKYRKPIKSRKPRKTKTSNSQNTRKNTRKISRKGLGKRFNQIKSMIETRLGKPREKKPTEYKEEMVISLNSNEDFPDCLALESEPVKCEGATERERKKHYRKQSMKFHPDKNKGCPDIANTKFKQLTKCCNPENEYRGEC